MGDVMKIPELADNVKDFFQYVLIRSTYSEGLMYIGDYKDGYVFTHKDPKKFIDMCCSEPAFLYVKDDLIYAVDRCVNYSDPDDMYHVFLGMLNEVNEDKCYTITLDDENK